MKIILANCPTLTADQIEAILAIVEPARPDIAEQQAHDERMRQLRLESQARQAKLESMVDEICANPYPIPPFQGQVKVPLTPPVVQAAIDYASGRPVERDTSGMTETRTFRRDIAKTLEALQEAEYSDEREQAIIKLREALMWLAADLKRIKTQ